jgi:hypothetical protein
MEPYLPASAPMRGMHDIAPPLVVPLVLQVSLLPNSSHREEFFYDPSPNDHHGPIAAVREFFLVQGHVVIIHTCPYIAAFQAVCPLSITLRPLSYLPPRLFTKGYARLQELAIAVAIAAPDDPPAPHKGIKGIVLDDLCTSLFNSYADIPSVSLLAASQPPVLPPSPLPVVGASPGHPSVARASYGGSHPSRWPDLEGFNIGGTLPSSLWVEQSLYKGYSSHSFGFERQYDSVLPVRHGWISVLSMQRPGAAHPLYGGLPPGSPMRHSAGDFHGLPVSSHPYGGIPHADGIPPVVYGGVTHDPPLHRFPHVPASVRSNLGFPGAFVHSLAHDNLRSSLASDVTMSLSIAGRVVPPHLAPTMAQPGVVPHVAPHSSPLIQQFGVAPQAFDQVATAAPPWSAPPPAAPTTRSFKPLKLCRMKDTKAFIDS